MIKKLNDNEGLHNEKQFYATLTEATDLSITKGKT